MFTISYLLDQVQMICKRPHSPSYYVFFKYLQTDKVPKLWKVSLLWSNKNTAAYKRENSGLCSFHEKGSVYELYLNKFTKVKYEYIN
jgi:hypothetical protein